LGAEGGMFILGAEGGMFILGAEGSRPTYPTHLRAVFVKTQRT
jgi:hypothetical protein